MQNLLKPVKMLFHYLYAYKIAFFSVEKIQNIEAETTTEPKKAKAKKKKFGTNLQIKVLYT